MKLSELIQKKFTKDVAANIVSYLAVSISVIAINTIINNAYNTESLGIYNSVFALYVILSSIGIAGLSSSILKFCSENCELTNENNEILSNSLMLIAICSTLTTVAVSIILKFIPQFENIFSFYIKTAIAIPLFSLNKGFRYFLNSKRKMFSFAITEFVRWISVFVFILICVVFQFPFENIFFSFIFAEIITSIFLIFLSENDFYFAPTKDWLTYKQLLGFGLKTLAGDSIVIISNKIDILMVALLTSNFYTGIYSFACEIAKGMLLLGKIIQVNLNPIISKLCYEKDFEKLRHYLGTVRSYMFKIMTTMTFASFFIFPIYIHIFLKNPDFNQSIHVFYTLLIGVYPASLFYWFGSILTMAGFPEDGFTRNLIFFICIVVFNLILIPPFGILGAAVATSLTYFIRIMTLYFFVKKRLQFNIFRI